MKNSKLIIGAALAAGAVAVAYTAITKNNIADNDVVDALDIRRYLGLWNEVARLPNIIEKNLTGVTDEYSMDGDGSVKVFTKAYNNKKQKWQDAWGKIKFDEGGISGKLKVSYFGPVYMAYNVLDVDDDYRYALVSGGSLNFLWLLSRDNAIPDDIKARFLQKAGSVGFDTTKLEWV